MSHASVRKIFGAAMLSCVLLLSGCGSNSSVSNLGTTGPIPGESTQVTVLISSTANDQVASVDLVLDGLMLTDQAGKTVNVLPASENAEFIHLNGRAEPLLTAAIPQDVYTSATAQVGQLSMTCAGLNTSNQTDETFINQYGYTPGSLVTVKLPSPVTVRGSSMGISLDLLVSSSANWATANCTTRDKSFKMAPTFSLTSLVLSPSPASPSTGKFSGLRGLISSVDSVGSSFTVSASDGSVTEIQQTGATVIAPAPVWQVDANSSTALQGVSSLTTLTVGMPVNFDATLQSDGSMLATRMAVDNPNTTNLTVSNGPVIAVLSPVLFSSHRLVGALINGVEGYFANKPLGFLDSENAFNFDHTQFQTSKQLSNLQSLPFKPSFDANSMVAGQNISVSTNGTTILNTPVSIAATTITLLPQTINGAVSAVSTSGSFSTYTVTLAPYDLFLQFAQQPSRQTTVLANPNTVEVYADSSTAMLNSSAPAVGTVLRFTGLVFNDNGTLRMDCSQINDGVPE